jgi:predicted lipid-binding transport protein (Tim44 family)
MRARAVYLGLFATTLGFTLAAATRQFAPASSIGVSAKEIGSARNIVTRWQTSWGSFDRDYLATPTTNKHGNLLSPSSRFNQ